MTFSSSAVKMFDCTDDDEMVWDEVREYSLEEFPGVTFRWSAVTLEAVTDTETIQLYWGMPIWSVYFCDLNGDGKREICSTVSIGSGMVDERILVHDYANRADYQLSDRGYYDYRLILKDGQLWAEKRPYRADGSAPESGPLALRSVIADDGSSIVVLIMGPSSETK